SGDFAESVEKVLRWRRGLTDHAVGGLRTHIEFKSDFLGEAALFEDVEGNIGGAVGSWTGISFVIAFEEANVAGPGVAARFGFLRLKSDERWLAFARENDGVVALHAPIVGKIEDVVGRADNERVDFLFFQQRADAAELLLVNGPRHARSPRAYFLL